MVLLSIISVAAIASGPDVMLIAVSVVLALAIGGVHKIFKIDSKAFKKCSPVSYLISAFVLLVLSVEWADRWGISAYFGIVIAILGTVEVLNICSFINSKIKSYVAFDIKETTEKMNWKEYAFIAVLAFVAITLFSKCSFLYPLNDWVDANSVFSAGKMVAKGDVLYRDVFEQKGIIFILLHSLASFISKDSFIGIYIFEVVAAFLFGTISYRIILLISGKRYLFLMPVIYALTYSSIAFTHGDSVEEFALPILAFAVLTGLEICVLKKFDMKKILLTGLGAGIIFWMKYLVLGFFVGFVIYMVIFTLKNKLQKELGKSVLMFLIGFIVSCVPAFVYFGVNKAMSSLWQGYFYNNIFVYSAREYEDIVVDVPHNLLRGMLSGTYENLVMWLLVAIGIALISNCSKKTVPAFFKTTLLSTIFVMYMTAGAYKYYTLVLYVWAPVILAVMVVIIVRKLPALKINPMLTVLITTIVALSLGFVTSPNRYMFMEKKDNLPQYKFKAIMEQTENPKVFNFHYMDAGVYTVMGITPDTKYFCKINVPMDDIDQSQIDYIHNEKPDYIVTVNEEFSFKDYELIDAEDYFYEVGEFRFFLYKMK